MARGVDPSSMAGGGHKLCVDIEMLIPSASTITSRGSLRSSLVGDINPKLNEGGMGYTHFAV